MDVFYNIVVELWKRHPLLHSLQSIGPTTGAAGEVLRRLSLRHLQYPSIVVVFRLMCPFLATYLSQVGAEVLPN